MSQAVLFDLDGALVDSAPAIVTSFNFGLESAGREAVAASRVRAMIGIPLQAMYGTVIGAPPESDVVRQCVEAYRSRYHEVLASETHVVPGIQDALDALAERYVLAVATTKPRLFAEAILSATGLREAFATVVGPELSALAETKRETVGRAIAAVDAARVLALVGDRDVDVEAARVHGLGAIGVTWGYGSRAELEAARANAIVEDPARLEACIDQALGGVVP